MRIVFRCPPELKDVLPEPYPAKRSLPNWLKQMPMMAYSPDLERDIRTLKHCPPFVDAMSFGFMIPLPTDLRVDKDVFEWDWHLTSSENEAPASQLGWYPQSPIGYHVNSQAIDSPLFDEHHAIVKFFCFWTIELDPGFSLYVMHPVNRLDLPFRTVTGMVDCDLYHDAFVHFPAIWIDPDFHGVLEKGTPVAQCVVVKRETYDLEFGELRDDSAERFVSLNAAVKQDQHLYKNRYRAKKT